ncbi:CGNR zinc finger domain-containing protein [Streptomyces sp. MS2.AVA.5]|uniref:CGNR zinc finger domain-containing protein n=1 Tax=Streptomyces achmelvichensis TaxID=3134111 RepID=A0ACC6PNW8_9ACTN
MSEEDPAATADVAMIGGHPVLDFVNTVAWRHDEARRADRVNSADAWARWGVAAGVLRSGAASGQDADEPARLALVELREALWAVLDALVDDRPLPLLAWDSVRRALVEARAKAALPPTLPLRWQPAPPGLAALRGTLALQAEQLLASDDLHRIHRCAGPGCGWFFLDRSRAGTRRWCSSGDCGNRDRARRHYARKHPSAGRQGSKAP